VNKDEFQGGPLPGDWEYLPGGEVFLAMVESAKWKQALEEFCLEQGLDCQHPGGLEQFRARMGPQDYRGLVLEDGPGIKGLLDELSGLEGRVRRYILCILISDAVDSLDPRAAFLRAVDCCLQSHDSAEAKPLLDRAYAAFVHRLWPWRRAEQQPRINR
jgi:hypothetical protein